MSKVYKGCKLYKRSDSTHTTVALLDIEFAGTLTNNSGYASDSMLSENSYNNVITRTSFDYVSGNYNIIIPDMGDLKVTGWAKTQDNVGNFKRKFRYRLTLEG